MFVLTLCAGVALYSVVCSVVVEHCTNYVGSDGCHYIIMYQGGMLDMCLIYAYYGACGAPHLEYVYAEEEETAEAKIMMIRTKTRRQSRGVQEQKRRPGRDADVA
jgi:hypothetical protein